MKHLEEEVRSFVKVITGCRNISDTDRDVTALPIRYGGLAIPIPSQHGRQQIRNSDFLTEETQKATISGEVFQSDLERKMKISTNIAISHKISYEKILGKTDKKS